MPFWEANRRLLMGLALALALMAAYQFFFVGPIRAEASDLRERVREIEGALRGHTAPGREPASAETKRVEAQRGALEEELGELRGMTFKVEAPYVLDPDLEVSKYVLRRDELVHELRARCAKSPVAFPAEAPVGFKNNDPQKEGVELVLERLAVTARLVEALERSGFRSARLVQEKREQAPAETSSHLRRVPVKLVGVATEESLVRFLAEISRRGEAGRSFLSLDSLEIKVASAKAVQFTVTARVSGVLERQERAPARDAAGPLRRP